MKILLIDNYDSFTYNLYQYLKRFVDNVKVYENDKITIEKIHKLNPDGIVISPGPGNPYDAGISLNIVKEFEKEKHIFGVCLGHQVIAKAYGTEIIKSNQPVHGKSVKITHDEEGIFNGLPSKINVGLYHSLIVDEKSLNSDFIITSRSIENKIMGIRHKQFNLEGVQFHPESILTEHGYKMIENWVNKIK